LSISTAGCLISIAGKLNSFAIPLLRTQSRFKSQVFFTTHSPYVLDEFFDRSEQVFVVERGRPLEGATIPRLSERHQGKLKIARETFEQSLGETWVNGLLGATAGAKP